MIYTNQDYFKAAIELAIAVHNGDDIASFGLIDVKKSNNPEYGPNLRLLNYKPECAFKDSFEWNVHERVSRGLVVENGRVIAFPFPKFFNFGDEVKTFTNDEISGVYTKEDGSLGIAFLYNGKFHVTTHGSLDSDQGKWATNFLRNNPVDMNSNETHLFEIIYPENRVVTNYGDEQKMILLTSYYFNQDNFVITEHVPNNLDVGAFSVNQLLDICKNNNNYNMEGFVVKLKDGRRVKFKTDAYLAVHKIRFAISEKKVHEIMMNSPEVLEDWKKTLPNEFFEEVDEITKNIHSTVSKASYLIEILMEEAREELLDIAEYRDRKRVLAQFALKNVPENLRGAFFTLYDKGAESMVNNVLKIYFNLVNK